MTPAEQVATWLHKARRVLFITGAGLSAESGLPTYRGLGGLYEDAETPEGVTIEQALSGGMLRRHPALCWKYIAQIEQACRGAEPNRAHGLIAAFQDRLETWVLTQNVDGFHGRAGSRNVIPIHGDIHQLYCPNCRWDEEVADYAHLQLPPHCPRCQSIIRPRVVLFGEMLPPMAMKCFNEQLQKGFDLVFSVGTSSGFSYIAQPIVMAISRGVPTVEINPGTTPVTPLVRLRFSCGAVEALESIWRVWSVKAREI